MHHNLSHPGVLNCQRIELQNPMIFLFKSQVSSHLARNQIRYSEP